MKKIEVYAVCSTYEEAKGANPYCDIFTNSKGQFRAIIDPPTSHFANDWKLVKPTPQTKEVEWVNGDECLFVDKNGDEKICKVIGLYPPFVESYVLYCESANPTFFISNVGRMIKPETEAERLERELDERAKEIMIDLCGDKVFEGRDWEYHKKFTHSANMAFKLVDLGYRKG